MKIKKFANFRSQFYLCLCSETISFEIEKEPKNGKNIVFFDGSILQNHFFKIGNSHPLVSFFVISTATVFTFLRFGYQRKLFYFLILGKSSLFPKKFYTLITVILQGPPLLMFSVDNLLKRRRNHQFWCLQIKKKLETSSLHLPNLTIMLNSLYI